MRESSDIHSQKGTREFLHCLFQGGIQSLKILTTRTGAGTRRTSGLKIPAGKGDNVPLTHLACAQVVFQREACAHTDVCILPSEH